MIIMINSLNHHQFKDINKILNLKCKYLSYLKNNYDIFEYNIDIDFRF